VADKDDQRRELNIQLDELRRSLVRLRRQSDTSSPAPLWISGFESASKALNSVRTLSRLLQNEIDELQAQLERAEREAWDQKVRRADARAQLDERERVLRTIQGSTAWKIVKPIWKLFNRPRIPKPDLKVIAADLAFAVDLPKSWTTTREIVLIKGWCFARSGRQIAGIRAKIGRKSKIARYGLERPDIIDSCAEYPEARRSGFTIELKIPVGVSTVRLEMIEHGFGWLPFFETKLERVGIAGDEVDDNDTDASDRSAAPQRVDLLPALTPARASELLRPAFGKHEKRIANGAPSISVLTPTYNSRPEWLTEAGFSLLNQSSPNWEWCIVDDGSDNPETRKLLELLSAASERVRVQFGARGGISAATNRALDLARGDYVCFLDHDDLLHPLALKTMSEKFSEGYDVVYSDEDKLDNNTGNFVEPFFKPDWSPEYFRGAMYVGHLLCVRRELARRTRFDPAFDGVQDFEFMLRLGESAPRIGHVPQVLYHWRKTPGSIAAKTDAKPEIDNLQQRAVNAHLERLGFPARADRSGQPHRLVLVPAEAKTYPRVSIVIPTRDAPDVLGRCLKSIFEKTSHPNYEVIVMDNESTDERALALMAEYPVRLVPFPNPFNFSRANNLGAAVATGELLVFLNNDTEVMTADWLQNLAYYASQTDVGAAGALLAYNDETVQHAGVALGMRGTADHTMRRFPIDVDGYAGNLVCAREVSAVTGACLMMRKSLFEEIGGFNPHFFTAYQDVDLCLRLRARDLRVICTPRAMLIHHESVSRQSYYDMVDRMLLLDRWEEVIQRGDPYYNPNLDLERGDYSPRR
jgi:GT2 family glycosyltransferase